MKNENKQTEAQEAVELLKMEIDDLKTDKERAEFIIKQLSGIKRAYVAKNKEVSDNQVALLIKPNKDAPFDDSIKYNEDLKQLQYQSQVRAHSIDRLERQIAIGETCGWHKALADVYQDMHSLVCGEMIPI